MDPNEVYRRGDWCVMQHPDSDRFTYAVCDVREHRDPIKAMDCKAAIEIVDCLYNNAV